MRLDEATCRRLFAAEAIARLATMGPDGPHLVPIVFAIDGDSIVFAVDHKPKSTPRLRRMQNLMSDPRASMMADRYSPDWSQLWWVRADVLGTVSTQPHDVAAVAALLAGKYAQYAGSAPAGPVAILEVQRWTGWAATPGAVQLPSAE